jgi:uncharacterized repeat protein (TIGR02543 family)
MKIKVLKRLMLCCMLALIACVGGFTLSMSNEPKKSVSAATITRGVQVGDVLNTMTYMSTPDVLNYPVYDANFGFSFDNQEQINVLLRFTDGTYLCTSVYYNANVKKYCYVFRLKDSNDTNIRTFTKFTYTTPSSMTKPTVYTFPSFNFAGRTVASIDDSSICQILKVTEERTAIPLPADPTKTGYTFVGWYFDSAFTQAYDGSPIYEDTALYAKFEINQYTASFNTNGGSSVTAITQNYNTSISKPNNPTKTGYTFAGWYKDAALTQEQTFPFIIGSANITLYAKWTINQYTISFNTNGGSAVTAITQNYNTSITKPTDPTKTGYTFAGWFKDTGLTQEQTFPFNMGAVSISLYTKWDANPQTVIICYQGAKESDTVIVNYGLKLDTPADPTFTGHVFGGWYLDAECTQVVDFNTTIIEDITIYAKWTWQMFTVTFYVEGEIYHSQKCEYGTVFQVAP